VAGEEGAKPAQPAGGVGTINRMSPDGPSSTSGGQEVSIEHLFAFGSPPP
jgi:hypothetical protein